MDRKKKNLLSLILSLTLSCTLIPVGISKGWGIAEFAIGVATFIISVLIVCWDNEAAFHRNPNAKIRLGYNFLGCMGVSFGAQGLWGCWGEAMWFKWLGAALVIIGSVLIRFACCSKRDTTD